MEREKEQETSATQSAVIPKDFLGIKHPEFSVKVSISKVPARPSWLAQNWQKLCNSRKGGRGGGHFAAEISR